MPSCSQNHSRRQGFLHRRGQRNLAVPAQRKAITGGVDINHRLIIAPVYVNDGLVFIWTGIRPDTALFPDAVDDGVFCLEVGKT